ncbi:MAG: type II toxin-antitoxin system RelB/DinJ family antitoxin [Clostridiales bacterium]|nr:type II toxin-antitoxin system RelB/DinJ family antitoxin [Clostridiales bacterium]
MASMIQVRVDDELKSRSDALFKDLGTDTTSAIRMFLAQAVASNGFPFEIKRQAEPKMDFLRSLSEEEMIAMLEIARSNAEQGKIRDAASVISDLRAKYDL